MLTNERAEQNTYVLSAAEEAKLGAYFAAFEAEFMQLVFTFDWSLVAATSGGRNEFGEISSSGNAQATAREIDGGAALAAQPIVFTVLAGPMVGLVNPMYEGTSLGAVGVLPDQNALGLTSGGQSSLITKDGNNLGIENAGDSHTARAA